MWWILFIGKEQPPRLLMTTQRRYVAANAVDNAIRNSHWKKQGNRTHMALRRLIDQDHRLPW
jgi:hypothetical protein